MDKRKLKEHARNMAISFHQMAGEEEIKAIDLDDLDDLIDQLDESENCTEALLDLGQTLIRVQEERDKAEKELRELKNSQEEKVVLPDYIDECIRYAGTNIERNKEYVLRSIIEQHYKNDFEEKVYDWFMEKGNLLKFFRAVDNGYTVEEKKYRVRDKHGYVLILKGSNGDVCRSDSTPMKPDYSWDLTEQEIKDYDPRYMTFAAPVEEEKK